MVIYHISPLIEVFTIVWKSVPVQMVARCILGVNESYLRVVVLLVQHRTYNCLSLSVCDIHTTVSTLTSAAAAFASLLTHL
jgi:hypothetical protein